MTVLCSSPCHRVTASAVLTQASYIAHCKQRGTFRYNQGALTYLASLVNRACHFLIFTPFLLPSLYWIEFWYQNIHTPLRHVTQFYLSVWACWRPVWISYFLCLLHAYLQLFWWHFTFLICNVIIILYLILLSLYSWLERLCHFFFLVCNLVQPMLLMCLCFNEYLLRKWNF